jgi:hypothetical protein
MFKESIAKVRERGGPKDNSRITARDHPSVIEVPHFSSSRISCSKTIMLCCIYLISLY